MHTGIQALETMEITKAELARHLGVNRSAITNWKRIPAERVVAIEKHTGIPRYVLRPDLYDKPGWMK